jgi:hypothetical protein
MTVIPSWIVMTSTVNPPKTVWRRYVNQALLTAMKILETVVKSIFSTIPNTVEVVEGPAEM